MNPGKSPSVHIQKTKLLLKVFMVLTHPNPVVFEGKGGEPVSGVYTCAEVRPIPYRENQMRGRCTAFSFILLAISFFPFSLHASGFNMGRMTSVNHYGAQDVTRNPALLGLQPTTTTMGATVNYRRELSSKVYFRELSTSQIKVDVEDSDFIEASVDYSRKFGRFVLGINLSSDFDSNNTLSKGLFLTPTATLGRSLRRERNRTYSGAIAVAIRLGSSHSIGVRSDISYQQTHSTESGHSLTDMPSMLFKETTTIEENSVNLNPEIGYHFKSGAFEAGIIVTPGEPSWNEKKQEMERIRIGSPSDIEFKGKGNLPFTAQYRSGPGITAGVYTKRFNSVGAGLESGLVFPIAFDDHQLVPFNRFIFINSDTLRIKVRASVDTAVFLRGGIELHVSPRAILSLGGGLHSTAFSTRIKINNPLSPEFLGQSTIRRTSLIFSGTSGLDFLIGAHHTLTLGIGVSHFSVDERRTFRHPSQTLFATVMTSRTKIRSLNCDFIAAASVAF